MNHFIKYNWISIVPGASPYGVFPNQPQLYAAQGPPPPAYDQTLTHPMVKFCSTIHEDSLRYFMTTYKFQGI